MTPKKPSSRAKTRHKASKASKVSSNLDWLEETAEEAKEYDQRVKDEIQWKLDWTKPSDKGPIPQTSSPPLEPANRSSDLLSRPSSETEAELTLRDSSEPLDHDHNDDDRDGGAGFDQQDMEQSTMIDFSMPSFRPSHIAHSTPKPISTSTFPNIPTPSFDSTPELPKPKPETEQPVAGPSKTPRPITTTATFVETPTHIPSPIDTPTSRQGNMIGEGRGRRDDPATPVPLGVEKFQFLRGKKDFQTLTKHFEMFTKQSERQKKAALELAKGRDKGKLGKASEVLGGKVFEGLRFCFPPELGNTSKQKTHWDIVCFQALSMSKTNRQIAKRGGQVTLQPDTAVTHVIYDSGRSAQILARQLGLQTLSELPEGTVCVRYDWVVHCLRSVGPRLRTRLTSRAN
jgi:hypothetical protein